MYTHRTGLENGLQRLQAAKGLHAVSAGGKDLHADGAAIQPVKVEGTSLLRDPDRNRLDKSNIPKNKIYESEAITISYSRQSYELFISILLKMHVRVMKTII